MVSRDEADVRNAIGKEVFDLLEFDCGHAGLIVAGIPVEPQFRHAFEQWSQVFEPEEARRGVAKM